MHFIGEQLEAVHVQRQRAQAAHDLINYYIQFSRNDTAALDVLRKERGKEGRRELATVLRRLSAVAKEVDISSAEQVSYHACQVQLPSSSLQIDAGSDR